MVKDLHQCRSLVLHKTWGILKCFPKACITFMKWIFLYNVAHIHLLNICICIMPQSCHFRNLFGIMCKNLLLQNWSLAFHTTYHFFPFFFRMFNTIFNILVWGNLSYLFVSFHFYLASQCEQFYQNFRSTQRHPMKDFPFKVSNRFKAMSSSQPFILLHTQSNKSFFYVHVSQCACVVTSCRNTPEWSET